MQGETASSPPLDDPVRPLVSPIPMKKATSCWSGAPAELRSADLLFQARRLACSRLTYEQAEEQAWQEVESYVGTMDPYEFQKLVADLLKAMGYYHRG